MFILECRKRASTQKVREVPRVATVALQATSKDSTAAGSADKSSFHFSDSKSFRVCGPEDSGKISKAKNGPEHTSDLQMKSSTV